MQDQLIYQLQCNVVLRVTGAYMTIPTFFTYVERSVNGMCPLRSHGGSILSSNDSWTFHI